MKNRIFDQKIGKISKKLKFQKRHFQAKYSLLRRDMAIFRCFWPYFGTWRSQFWWKNKIVESIDFSRFRRLKWRIERPDWTSRKLRIVERKILYFLIFGVCLLASCGVNFEKILNRFSASENIFDEVSKTYPESQNLYRERVENPKRKIFYCKMTTSP